MLMAVGIIPSAVLGHSVGEVAASYVAGVLTLPQAVFLIHRRAYLQQTASGGSMLFLGKLPSSSVVTDLLSSESAGRFDKLCVAAFQSHKSLTISGERSQLEDLEKTMKRAHPGTFSRFLSVSAALHSPYMDCIKERFFKDLQGVSPRALLEGIEMYSTVLGKKVESGLELNVEYWWRNVRNAVMFTDAVSSAVAGMDSHLWFYLSSRWL